MTDYVLMQGLLGITLFKASAFLILFVLYLLLYRGLSARFLRIWLFGWVFYIGYAGGQVAFVLTAGLADRMIRTECSLLAGMCFLAAVQAYSGRKPRWSLLVPVVAACGIAAGVAEYLASRHTLAITWVTALSETALALTAGWTLWRAARGGRGYGPWLLAGAFMLIGLHNLDRPLWLAHPSFELRIVMSDLFEVALGMAMAVVILEAGRSRTEDLDEKLRRLTLITAASTQSFDVQRVLEDVLRHLVESLNASHGLVRLLEGSGEKAELVVRSAVGFRKQFLERYARVPVSAEWARKILQREAPTVSEAQQVAPEIPGRVEEEGLSAVVRVRLPGKEGALGILVVGSNSRRGFQVEEINFLVNVANLLGLTIQNVALFEQLVNAQKQWLCTFDSIHDPVLVHDAEGRILRSNQMFAEKLGKTPQALVGRALREVLRRGEVPWRVCPYCAEALGKGDTRDPNLGGGYFLTSNSVLHEPGGGESGTVHVLKDITDRRRAEERYRNLIENVQEGVFMSTPDGRFVDFNDAFMHMLGYPRREELLRVSIVPEIYVNPADRERLKKLLRDHGSVNNFEFQLRRRDGEILTVLESSFATRNIAGEVTVYQGFVLDITERKRAEQEIRRRNRELMVLNSIGQTLSQSFELTELLDRALRQVTELFDVDLGAIYLLEEESRVLRRVAAVGHQSEYARRFPPTQIPPELLESIRQARATVLSVESLPLPAVFRDLHSKEAMQAGYGVVLWAKDRMLGGLVVGCRVLREYSAAELNLLSAVGNQIAAAIEKSLLLEETQKAYEHLRRTQEQLLQSAKMAAVGQLISGVAHELNNPLTAILGYSQLLSSGEPTGLQAAAYVEKLYRQAQRTQRIVQNLLSFARQQKPERQPVNINQVVEDTLSLREYDLRVSNIQVWRELAADLPLIAGDAHQLQQVLLNILNNAVDAVLESSDRGEIWIRTAAENSHLILELTDSGPGVKDASRVFDPFYTTKPVGKGTGLGLSICYGIINEHDGEIVVRNTPPRGATFTMKFPALSAPASRRARQTAPDDVPQWGRILLVDDETAVLELEQEILKGRCQWVKAVGSAAEALRVLEQDPVDLVVTDLKMPGEISTRDLYQWIAKRKPELANRVIFTMSDARTQEVADLLKESNCAHIQKPFQVAGFLQVIRQALEQHTAATLKH